MSSEPTVLGDNDNRDEVQAPRRSPAGGGPAHDIVRPSTETAADESASMDTRFAPVSLDSDTAPHGYFVVGRDTEAVNPMPNTTPRVVPIPLLREESSTTVSDLTEDFESDRSFSSLLEPGARTRRSSSRLTPGRRRLRSRSASPAPPEVYDIREEVPRNSRFHDRAFQGALADSKRLMAELHDTLGTSSLQLEPDSTMQRLRQRTEHLADFQCPSGHSVAFVGDSGVGKSSLMNSLLDRRNLARTSNSGAACTCVVTEYHFHARNDYAVEVDFFDTEEMMKQLGDFLRSYRRYHLSETSRDSRETEDLSERASLALDTFRATFRGRLADDSFLVDSSEEDVLRDFRAWISEDSVLSMPVRDERATLEECSLLVMKLTSEDPTAEGPALWPYIRKIRVFLDAHILRNGLVLVDLPGLRDMNAARQHVTERYLLQCDDIFVVCNIGRATTDAGMMSVFELAQRAKLSNVGIVCTRSDDIQAHEARRDWEGQKARHVDLRLEAIQRGTANRDNIVLALEELNSIDGELTDEEMREHHHLSRDLRHAEQQITKLQFELTRYLVTTRNQIVETQLGRIYRDRIPQGRLITACVSNKMYMEHRDAPKADALPYLRLSGILTLREYCLSKVSAKQLATTSTFMDHDIPALLGDLELWVQSGSGSMTAERKEALRQTLDALEARLKRDMCGNGSKINDIATALKEEFRVKIYTVDQASLDQWGGVAAAACAGWSRWNHATYSAFCRHYGDYCTGAVGSRNWNEEAIKAMTETLTPPWKDFRAFCKQNGEQIRVVVCELLDWAVQYLDTEFADADETIGSVKQVLVHRKKLILDDIDTERDGFEDDMDTLRTDAFSGIRSSYIGAAMEDSYEHCSMIEGRGSDKRRKAVITCTLTHERLFENLLKEFKSEFDAVADVFQESLEEAANTHLQSISDTLEMVRGENAASESEQDPEFRARVEAALLLTRGEMSRMHALA